MSEMRPKKYSLNKQYDLYSAYTDYESNYKTNWKEKDTPEKLEYLRRLQEEGFKPIHENAAMEETLQNFKKRYDEQVKDGTLNEIPISKDISKPIVNKQNRDSSGAVVEKNPIKQQINIQKPKQQVKQPEVMTKEEQKTKFSVKNVVNYLKAEQSLATQGPVSLTVFEERKAICGECPHRKTHEQIPDELGFCTKCGCGANPRARLTNKIKMPQTSCPLDKWGTSTGIYKGVAGKLKYKLTPKSKREKLDYT